MNRLLVNQHIRAGQSMKSSLLIMAIVYGYWLLDGDMNIKEALLSYCISMPICFLIVVICRSFVAWSFRAIRRRSDYPRFITRAHNSRKR